MVSCQKEILVDLNSSAPTLIVQANLSNSTDKCAVLLTRSVNYNALNVFPSETGALVIVKDSTQGVTDTLVENKVILGYYVSSKILPIPNHVYLLRIETKGAVYKSISTMPDSVSIQGLNISTESSGFGFGGEGRRIRYTLTADFQDPAGTINYYRFVQRYKGVFVSTSQPINDNYRDGKLITQDLRINLNDTLKLKDTIKLEFVKGDTILVELQGIDKGAYDFFRTFRQGGGGPGFQDAAPGNPISNISNGALGYFSAYSSTFKKVVVP
jgi:hypothetical protein